LAAEFLIRGIGGHCSANQSRGYCSGHGATSLVSAAMAVVADSTHPDAGDIRHSSGRGNTSGKKENHQYKSLLFILPAAPVSYE